MQRRRQLSCAAVPDARCAVLRGRHQPSVLGDEPQDGRSVTFQLPSFISVKVEEFERGVIVRDRDDVVVLSEKYLN
jgi:hypothetical protein